MSQAKEHEQLQEGENDESFDEDMTMAQHYQTRDDNEDEGEDEEANFSRVDLSPRSIPPAREAIPPLQSPSATTSSTPLFGSISSPFAKLRFTVIALAGALTGLYLDIKQRLTLQLHLVFSLGMFAWWTAMVLMLTFFGPYSSVQFANGYFATWSGFLVATMMLSSRNDYFRQTVHGVVDKVSRRPAAYVAIASLVELAASIPFCVPKTECHSLNAFAVALGVVSLVISLVLLGIITRLSVVLIRQVAVFLCVWWTIGGMLVTFIGPFATMGNGYFAVVGAIAASLSLLQTQDPVGDGGGGEEESIEQHPQPVPLANLV
ncbi:hypothetical protein BASA81_005907 [Batrachochytrium salamandrivorans]|nr:hypothetical protein BASA81_005907 [Batrachochytrium salamandrivorans]